MSTQQPTPHPGGANLALATLFLGMFVLGSAELLVVGMLNLIAADLDVSIPAAGFLVTAYALGVAIGGPILTAATIRLDRRTVLAVAFLLFGAANLIAVATAGFGLFVAVRVITGGLHGLLVATAFSVGMAVVPPERAGRAISVVLSGVAVSTAMGVPLGTLLGQTVGWGGSFIAVAAFAALAMVGTLALVPPTPSTGARAGNQARYAFAPRVLAVLALCALLFASLFAALTYIVPFLEGVTGISGGLISVFLLAYGVATAIGSLAGGAFADRDAARTLTLAPIGVAVALLALLLVGEIAALVAVALLAWGFFAWSMAPSLQYRVVALAGPGGALAQSLPASAINVGIAIGSAVGGAVFGHFAGSSATLTGLVIVAVAIPVAWATGFLTPPAVPRTETPATEPADGVAE
ncbi:MFS transporter [Saccharothrix sp. AJ9571]|nr:MFS transporter [Saccharothrix sp. AJ9571]